jgi:hypothetical protein
MPPTDAERRFHVLCGFVPLPEMTEEEVEYLFRAKVEEADPEDATPDAIVEP